LSIAASMVRTGKAGHSSSLRKYHFHFEGFLSTL